MSSINNYYKDFTVDDRTKHLVERIMKEYKQLLRWIKNRPNKYGDDFKEDLYQMTLYNLTLNTYSRVNKSNCTDEEVIKYGAQSIYKAYLTSIKNLPVNMTKLDVYPYSIDEDYDESGRLLTGHVLVPAENDENLERLCNKTLEELVDSLPCDESTKKAILLIAQGYKQVEAAQMLGINKKALNSKLKVLRESKKFKSWAKKNGIRGFAFQ